MRKAACVVAAVAGLTLGGAAAAGAQVFTPTFQAPRLSNELGIYVSEDPLHVEGSLRRSFGGYGLGFRGGYSDVGDGSLTLGIEYVNPLQLAGVAPIDVALTLAGQVLAGDGEAFGAQVGLDFGYVFTSPEVTITPYLHPRLAIVDAGDEAELEVLADLGVNLDFRPNLSLRFGANLGEGTDWGVGLAWRTR